MSLNLKSEDVEKFQQRIREDPIFFAEKILGKPLWEKENEILTSIRDYPEVAVKSCNASGKTFTSARVVHWWLLGNVDSVVITTAPTGRQVKDILWREIKQAVAGKPFYPKDSILETKINIDNKWFALGLSTDQPDQFQGFHSAHLLAIVDEASGVEGNIFEAIDGLKPNRVLLTGNPLKNTGRFADEFKDKSVKKISISAFDTPNLIASGYNTFEKFESDWKNLSEVEILKKNRVAIPGLVTLNDAVKIARRYGIESDVFRVRVLGEFPKSEQDSFISIDEISHAMNREVEIPFGWPKVMGVDVARFGGDRTVFTVRQAGKVIRKEVLVKRDLMEIAGNIIRIAQKEEIQPRDIAVDAIGVGAGVVDRLHEQGFRVQGVNVASQPEDKEHYANLRAELYSKVKEWLKTGDLPRDDDYYELANIKFHFNSKGKLQMESKENMKKRGIESPDVADSLMLTFAKPKPIMSMPEDIGGVKPYYPDIGL